MRWRRRWGRFAGRCLCCNEGSKSDGKQRRLPRLPGPQALLIEAGASDQDIGQVGKLVAALGIQNGVATWKANFVFLGGARNSRRKHCVASKSVTKESSLSEHNQFGVSLKRMVPGAPTAHTPSPGMPLTLSSSVYAPVSSLVQVLPFQWYKPL